MTYIPGDLGSAESAVLESSNLTIGYEGQPAVRDIDLRLTAGRSLALVGTNGSGKSTLLKTIAGLLPAISGEVKVFGADPGKHPTRIAYVSQSNPAGSLLPLRAIDIVRMARFPARGLLNRLDSTDEALVEQALSAMDIKKICKKPLNSLSGGQRQRVFIAHALARRADLILLDEATLNLDVPGAELYRQALAESLSRGASLVLATHDISEARSCDQALLLAHRVVAYGAGSSVLNAQTLLETFGILIREQDGNIAVVEKEHADHHGHEDHDHSAEKE